MDDLPLTILSESERDRALERFHILEPFLEGGVPLTRVAADQGVPLRTLQRWVAKYRDSGLVGLSRTPRKDRGVRRLRTSSCVSSRACCCAGRGPAPPLSTGG